MPAVLSVSQSVPCWNVLPLAAPRLAELKALLLCFAELVSLLVPPPRVPLRALAPTFASRALSFSSSFRFFFSRADAPWLSMHRASGDRARVGRAEEAPGSNWLTGLRCLATTAAKSKAHRVHAKAHLFENIFTLWRRGGVVDSAPRSWRMRSRGVPPAAVGPDTAAAAARVWVQPEVATSSANTTGSVPCGGWVQRDVKP